MKYVNKFVRIFNFPFYFRGEVYDPFETLTLSEQNFDILFKDYVNSFYDAIKRATNQKLENLLSLKWEIKLLMNLNQLDMILMNAIKHIRIRLLNYRNFTCTFS